MTTYDYEKLQNGSDIRGIAIDGVPGETVNLDSVAANRIAKGFLYWLTKNCDKNPSQLSVCIGRDSRDSGEELADSFAKALLPYGVKVFDSGLSSTPAMYMSTIFSDYDCDGSVMVTASHLPYNRNGFKFFDKSGGLNKGDITDILVFAESDYILNSLTPGTATAISKVPLMDTYSAHLRSLIIDGVNDPVHHDKPLTGLSITVDAGNGAGGFYPSKVLEPLGADVSSSQFLEPDGTFPNHAPNPENQEAMASIRKKVVKSKSDLGIIFDTDVDRSSAVDENGREINRNGIVAMAAALIADDNPGTTVVTDSITSNQLTDFLEKELGLKHLRFKRGYKNVINKSMELNDAGTDSQLAIETSGHAAYKENYFLDDGAYLATKIVIKAALLKKEGKCISDVIAKLSEPVESAEVRLPIRTHDFASYGDKIIADLTNMAASGQLKDSALVLPNYEGVRISFNSKEISGWLLLRKSLHDPIMPLNMESDVAGGCDRIKDVIRLILGQYDQLDISKL